MDAVRNPFTPSAGSPPPELAGRDEILEEAAVGIARCALGRTTKNLILTGLRGVGKTVLLDQIGKSAEADGQFVLRIEAPEGRSLPALLSPHLRVAILNLSRVEAAKTSAQKALRALAGFARALKVKYGDIELSMRGDAEPGLADSGELDLDLMDLFLAVGQAAKDAGRVLVLLIDELQYVPEVQLGSLISALHRCSQSQLPVILVSAGLPQVRGQMGNAKSYSERLFEFKHITRLYQEAASEAIVRPLAQEGVEITQGALQMILDDTDGYPYFLQEWGKHSWDLADESPIEENDVVMARDAATASLDASFFGVRFDRLTPFERRYLRAMAELGGGPHRSGDVATVMKRETRSLGPVRNSLIAKGMIWSPAYGETAFTVPLFDQYIRRVMPDLE